MAHPTAKSIHKTAPRAGSGSYIIENGLTLYEGMLVQLDGGYLTRYDETGLLLGVLQAGNQIDNGGIVGDTSALPPVEARVDESGMTLMHIAVGGSPTQANVGAVVYSADSNVASITKTPTAAAKKIGWIKRFRTASDCDVQLYTPAEFLAENS